MSATEASARVIAAVSTLPLAAALFGSAATTQKQAVGERASSRSGTAEAFSAAAGLDGAAYLTDSQKP
ncbi:hypothetical protein ACF1G5_17495 [Streptomyces coeruleorubidus]|uniref:hypothetical protein n=1 Tax=Streptomyces coeruleorubidus TaxID=116188 RepID=UPI0036FB1E9A